jgi:magnesium transporter
MSTNDLLQQTRALDPQGAAEVLSPQDDREIALVLGRMNPAFAVEVLEKFDDQRRLAIETASSGGVKEWEARQSFDDDTVGRLMDSAPAVFLETTSVGAVIEALRDVVARQLVTYVFAVDEQQRLLGVVTFRDLLYAVHAQKLSDIMLRKPFTLRPDMSLEDAMREVVTKHFPVYPVCDDSGRLLGCVRGQILFEQQAFEISAQAGSMVGVEKEERLSTPWPRAFRFRHPWLQINLLTAFVAGAVVAIFQGAIDQIVVLATFLPILAGQCGNTGCQALAVTLRGMTLGEIKEGKSGLLIIKEGWLGLLNGATIGLIAAAGMYFYANSLGNAQALWLGVITWVALTISCVVSGIAGASIPLVLKRLGADPATASSIFLTTATDVVSMGVFLGLATAFLL